MSTDTLDRLCEALQYRFKDRLATFTGAGGRMFRDEQWVAVSKLELVEAFKGGVCEVLLATDAASEGLNLQVVGTLINYDLPWNPMRVEQRIGRIDRIGQRHRVVHVVNQVIPDTVEDAVYRRLSERIDLFHSALGAMQPILGAAEGVMKDAYAAPRTERRQVLQEALNALDSKHRELERTGIELDDEDPMPMPIYPPTPIDLEDLRTLLTTDLDVNVTHADVASTFDPELASHDAQDRTALVTFGHPDLEHALERVARADVGEPVVRVEKDGVIAWARGDGLKRSRRCPESAQPSTPASTRDDLCARQVEPQQVEPQTVKDSG